MSAFANRSSVERRGSHAGLPLSKRTNGVSPTPDAFARSRKLIPRRSRISLNRFTMG